MSKASELQDLKARSRLNLRANFAEVGDSGDAVICSRFGGGQVRVSFDEAAELGRWLVEMFSDAPSRSTRSRT